MPWEKVAVTEKRYEDIVADPEKALHSIVEWWLADSETDRHLRKWLENRIPCAANKAVNDSSGRQAVNDGSGRQGNKRY